MNLSVAIILQQNEKFCFGKKTLDRFQIEEIHWLDSPSTQATLKAWTP